MSKPDSLTLPAPRHRWITLPRVPLTSMIALVILTLIVAMAIFAPWIAPHDPVALSPAMRLKPPGAEFWLGTDAYGRDLFSRIVYGARISLIVGVGVTVMSVLIGLPLGLLAGYFRGIDALMMRVMDGLMAIPGILLAIAIVSLSSAGIWTVMIAIMVPEIPQVVRLVRSRVLSTREEPYVEAAVLMGTSTFKVLTRHLMPNTLAPLIVQSTYICASAILTEAILSFLGAGIGTEIPTWGNIISEGRVYFQLKPSLVLWAGLALSLCILSINLLGDAVSDALDPRLKKRGAA
ncbi:MULTISPECIES: ABC transporter permease [Lonsdalea]|uniref:Peptide ABC transporter permease n=2 Tax=Lonsdalea TaxID=1082702 RepID=A0ACD1J8C5_9GAMM|nr:MULTISPECIES: ABC transporter permease [Lonsdalea]OSM96281.1 peptide ABC transporter permease [Lonsdalea populi]OSM96620.1 peptide ABC transporter permease [Lonsdalea populi]QPQ23803.1 ABC transporter permease [Lonsdalea populi]RAT10814.1 peptide ABC transporter permease [Lonsdalea quercina]RAT15890.1 peptide ABC transporter permease [Lonsdalea quercina]